ncbi:MAG: glycosyltransferase family 4 protein [Planctomycetaceae bacterium]|nr:glycosyltransferase family 4 protein [Planctomycetaceae bacterium]
MTVLRIAAVEPSGRLYGSEYCLLDIVDGLKAPRWDWTVVLPRGYGFDQVLIERGVKCQFTLPPDLGGVSRWKKAWFYFLTLCHLRFARPDVLYVNQAGCLRAASFWARMLSRPVVCQVQTLEDARWISREQRLHRWVLSFICNSRFIAKATDVPEERKCVLFQGVPESRWRNSVQYGDRPHRSGANGRTIGILGRIAVSKGHYLLLQAAKTLVRRGVVNQVVVIGDGLTAEDTCKFREAVADTGLLAHFEFRGYRADVASEMSRIDLLVIPSLAEPLGRVLLDAAEFGVPCVVSDSGGLGELSRRFGVGQTFHSGDSDDLVAKVEAVFADYESAVSQFRTAGTMMLKKLEMSDYLEKVELILRNAAAGRVTNLEWFGST